jgi:hypothetical protein
MKRRCSDRRKQLRRERDASIAVTLIACSLLATCGERTKALKVLTHRHFTFTPPVARALLRENSVAFTSATIAFFGQ